MRIQVIIQCSSVKAATHPRPLRLAELLAGVSPDRQRELRPLALPAEKMYAGTVYPRLFAAAREIKASVWIISAGYGLIHQDQELLPYNATFQHRRPAEIISEGAALGLPSG